ncbi:MAG: hypothetical protein J4N36_06375 [Chloroflexi bacterium]|nr:hypothetical protein [Chloroflexota bacterium]MCI0784323.1 hypothetical protein [Chloroflexota bacterium]MCI0816954.1 hypothetical protein [Chloroflexota bacterium]MCI0818744.1 hypothetical protein [Chloroflexota bacterium]MCI0843373.1 hypothetical protein [Chloroflexota bacterium]
MAALQVTIDTNVLIDGLDGVSEKRAAFDALLSLRREGKVEIALSTRLEQDKSNDSDVDRIRRHYEAAASFDVIGAPARIEVSRIGSRDVIADGEQANRLAKLFGVEKPATANKHTLWDVDHLYAHWSDRRNVFLTYDRPILNKRGGLKDAGIVVMDPREFIAQFMIGPQA